MIKFSSSENSPFKLKLTKLSDKSKTHHVVKNISLGVKRNKELQDSSDQCSLSCLTGKQIQSIDYQLYDKIIHKDSKVLDSQIKASLCIQVPQKVSPYQTKLQLPKKYTGFKKQKPRYQIAFLNKERKYAGRLTAKQYYKNIDLMDRSSPLQMWKQLSRSYTKANKENQVVSAHCGNRQQFQKQPKKKLNDKCVEMLINGQKDNLPEDLYKKTKKMIELQEVIGKWKQGQEQKKKKHHDIKAELQMQGNIVLRKSFSCKTSLHNFQSIHLNENIQSFITEQQQTTQLPGLKKKDSKRSLKKGSLPTEPCQQHPIMLIHKQPLDEFMKVFFKPAKQFVNPKLKAKPLEMMRVKSKKLTTRNIECLQRLKNNLFRERSNRDLFNNNSSVSVGANVEIKSVKRQQQQEIKIEETPQQQMLPVKIQSKRSSDQSISRLLKKESKRSTEGGKEHSPRSTGREFATKSPKNPTKDAVPILPDPLPATIDRTQTPSQNKQSLSSSKISFSEQPTPQMHRTNMKRLSLINAW